MKKDNCYLCNEPHKDYFTTYELFDGRVVPVCPKCKLYYDWTKEEGKKRGIYSSNSRKGLQNNKGGDKMKVEKGSTGGNNIGADFVTENKLTKLKILDEGTMDTFTPKEGSDDKPNTRLLLKVSYEGQKNDDPTHWRLNNKSLNALIDIWGDDTNAWIGKEPEIGVSGEGDFKHIVVDTLRTK